MAAERGSTGRGMIATAAHQLRIVHILRWDIQSVFSFLYHIASVGRLLLALSASSSATWGLRQRFSHRYFIQGAFPSRQYLRSTLTSRTTHLLIWRALIFKLLISLLSAPWSWISSCLRTLILDRLHDLFSIWGGILSDLICHIGQVPSKHVNKVVVNLSFLVSGELIRPDP